MVWILCLLLVGFLLVSYIVQANQLTRTSFSIASYEEKLASVSQENEELEISLSQASSLANLESLLKSLNYVEVNKIHYIQLLEGQMAAR
ncbi:MAG: hypothetical protein DRZ76_01015 [Candidatus Nealsonbacteria bacterium]|nr:MAG: hypothetical protein DRZ76_01015 [Candidatus Nealsonbacteria bacterium]